MALKRVKYKKTDGITPMVDGEIIDIKTPVPLNLPQSGKVQVRTGLTFDSALLLLGTPNLRSSTSFHPAGAELVLQIENMSGGALLLSTGERICRALPLADRVELVEE